MIKTHYMLTIDYFQSPIPFREFENELKQYPEFYNNKDVISKKKKIEILNILNFCCRFIAKLNIFY